MIVERIGLPLGMSETDCLAKLPARFPEKPTNNLLRLTVPIIVPRFEGVNWLQVIDAAGFYVTSYLRARIGELSLWQDPRGIEDLPDKPYAVWIQDGSRYVKRRPIDVRMELQKGERGGTH